MKIFDDDMVWYIMLFVFTLALCLSTFRNKIERLEDRITYLEKALHIECYGS